MKRAPKNRRPLIERDQLKISLRAFVPPKTNERVYGPPKVDIGPSGWTLIFDTETTTDAAQALRIGAFQVRKGAELFEAGLFYDPTQLLRREVQHLESFAEKRKIDLLTAEQFVEEIFYGRGFDLRATIVGLNLAFDISRLAVGHGSARGQFMQGGFTFKLSPHRWRPNVQVKHLSARASAIRFITRGKFTRGMRKRNLKAIPRPGYFADIKTLAAALTSQTFSLKSLADFLGTENRKKDVERHGGPLSTEYIEYALQDVQVTWECYQALLERFEQQGFKQTYPHQIYSEAGIGKASFKEMGIRSLLELQPNIPPELLGKIMSSYYGGRSEIHLRRVLTEVAYCDFLSMYPTVCTLMNLWPFVIAKGFSWSNKTKEIRQLVKDVKLDDLQNRNFWRKLSVLVQVIPNDDIFPVRAKYRQNDQQTIGLNYLKSKTPLWFTLADVIASKLRSGKLPRILKAIKFEPNEFQDGLNPINIAGNPEYRIDPYKDDFFQRVIELRLDAKQRAKTALPEQKAILEAEQGALKIIANSTSYGISIELNVEDLPSPQRRSCYGYAGKPFNIRTEKVENPGRYFNPLLATLITGAARLMLAITETLARRNGLDWAFCDTDSMAIVKTNGVEATFKDRVEIIRKYFEPLNPYSNNSSILKLEIVNFGIGPKSSESVPLYFLGISAKRYALFNLRKSGEIIIRKASAHGLGHLIAPYSENEAPNSIPAPLVPLAEIGVERWQYDLWHQIIRVALDGHPDQVDLNYHAALNLPAASRYGGTTPALLGWFKKHNQNREYSRQVRPFNFMLGFQVRSQAHLASASVKSDLLNQNRLFDLKPIAPFGKNISQAALNCFDRETGKPIPIELLKTYREALAQYHLRSEAKFLNGDYLDRGETRQRYVEVIAIRHIGKEANRWEEQFYLGADEGAEIDYGPNPEDAARLFESLKKDAKRLGQRTLARKIGIPQQTLSRWLRRKGSRLFVQNLRKMRSYK
jgi:hypothetical protein